MDVDYDATVCFLHQKHEGNWDKIVASFRVFLQFAKTLGPVEMKQLSHIEAEMMTEKVLKHRLQYFLWKEAQKRKERRRQERCARVSEADLEEDTIFGGKARPSRHNVLVESLSTQMDAIVDNVKSRLPAIADDSESDDDSTMPEVFFSGLDWSKIKLPGDEGWSDSDNEDPLPARQPYNVPQKATPDSVINMGLTSQQLASRVLPSSVLPQPSSVTEALDKLEADMQKSGVDFDAWKRMLNPPRPKRPSECVYDADGFPISGIPTDVAQNAAFDDEVNAYIRKTTAAIVVPGDTCAITSTPPKQASQQPTQRPGRWTVIEHSDSSDDENTAIPKGGHKGSRGAPIASGRGGGGYKGGKGGKA